MPTIAECVEPLRTSAMDRAEQFAREYADRLLADLAACGGDAEVFAPYPKNTMGRAAYMAALLKYGLVRRLTNPVNSGCRSPRDPDFRVPNPVGVAKFVEEARQDADRQYSAFIAKLESKVGPHSDANLRGDHVWSYSVLTVETPTGRQDWKTQQILNVSKLGKVFNQWPTRLVGAAKASAEVEQSEPVAVRDVEVATSDFTLPEATMTEAEADPKTAALAVIALTPHIREYLAANDPKALQQVQDALLGLGGPVGVRDAAPGFTPAEVSEQEAALIAEKYSGRAALEGELAAALAGKADAEAKGEALLIGFYSERVKKLKGRLHRLTGNPVKLYDATRMSPKLPT